MSEQPILHHAEELGQARAYTKEEASALLRLALIVGFWMGAVAMIIGAGYLLYERFGFWTTFYILALPAGVVVGAGVVLIAGAHEQIDGLRSWREATTYAPPVPQPQLPAPPDSPFIVHPRHQPPYLAYRDGQSIPLLPDGRESRLALNPPTVRAILQEVIQQHNGQWSRDRLMRIQVNGQRVTRKFYEKLTAVLAKSGFLQERAQGGFQLPSDVQTFEDVAKYIPALVPDNEKESRTAGGPVGRQEWERSKGDPPPRKGMETLAERHRLARLTELEHSVKNYLERKGGGDA